MIEQALRSKFVGALIGTAVGDALGAPFQGRHRVTFEEIEEVAEGLRVLTYTDDTHMMIGIAESLIRVRGFDGKDMMQTFIRNYELEPYRGYGPGPPYIFRLVRSGEAWNQAAQKLYPGGSYGNGAAMRIAPVGVLCHDNPSLLREIADESSQLTHTHDLGKEGAALQAYAVALAASLEPPLTLDRSQFLAKLTAFVQDGVYKQKLSSLERILTSPDKSKVVAELGNGIEAFNSVPTAIYSFLLEPESFGQAVFNAISLGGDTDTIGAMTGAISGAYLGIESIPLGWRSKLENEPYIAGLADQLFSLCMDMKHGEQEGSKSL